MRTRRVSHRTASARARAPSTLCEPAAHADVRAWRDAGRARRSADESRARRDVYRLYWNPNCFWLAGPEGDDAAHGIVGRNTYGHPIAWHHLDSEAAHSTAQLGQHFVAGVTLHTVKTATVNRHDCALHVYQIVLAQLLEVLSL